MPKKPSYASLFNPTVTPQTQAIAGTNQQQNNAGGYSYVVDKWTLLERFLILGSDKPTYYSTAQSATKLNGTNVILCLKEDYKRTIDTIVDVSDKGRAAKNDPALFALAIASASDNVDARKYALSMLKKVARTGTHLLTFVSYATTMRGWGRIFQDAISDWYTSKGDADLAYQLMKYQQREGWSQRDVLRLAHTTPLTESQGLILKFATGGELKEQEVKALPSQLQAHLEARKVTTAKEIVSLINAYGIPRESIPTQFLNDTAVWEAMLHKGMPLTAMIRNLAKMTSLGMMTDVNNRSVVTEALGNTQYLKKSRIHPFAVLLAMSTYKAGRGKLGSLTWNPHSKILDALDTAFYSTFGNVEPTGKYTVLGIDVSGSMTWDNGTGITPRMVAAAMALITMNVEDNYEVMAFTDKFVPLSISPRQRLDDVMKVMERLQFGRTDCSLPMVWAIQNKINAENFAVYTDNETYAGRIHPSQALRQHRQTFGTDSRLAVVAATPTPFSIADSNDRGMMDFVGFDSSAPSIMSEFFRGNI